MSIAADMIAQWGKLVTVKRYAALSFVNGRKSEGAETTFTSIMSIQPMGDKELLILPEGQRTRRTVKAYTATQLKTGDKAAGTSPDKVIYDGATFEVQRVEKWDDGDLGNIDHYKAILAEVNA